MKYKVSMPFIVFVTAEIEADSKKDTIEIAIDEVGLTNYCGNGGFDRLIGSYDTDHTIECGDFFESSGHGINIIVEES